MAWNNTNPVAVGDPTKKDHYDTIWNNAAHHRNSSGNFEITKSDADEAVNIADSNSSSEHTVKISRTAGTGSAINIVQTSDKITHGTTTKYLMLSPMSFVPAADTYDWVYQTGGYLQNRTILTNQIYRTGINLPDGAIITAVTIYGSLTASGGIILGILHSFVVTDGTNVTIADSTALRITGSTGYLNATDSVLTGNTIDNSTKQYYLSIHIDPSADVADTVFVGAKITYTVANLKQTI